MPPELQSPEIQAFANGFPIALMHIAVTAGILLIGVVGYPVLWFVADRNPNLFETVAVVLSRTPRTRGKSDFGGDRHVS